MGRSSTIGDGESPMFLVDCVPSRCPQAFHRALSSKPNGLCRWQLSGKNLVDFRSG